MNGNENLEKKLIVMSQKLSEREFEELLSVIATYLSDEGGIFCEINEKGEVISCKIC